MLRRLVVGTIVSAAIAAFMVSGAGAHRSAVEAHRTAAGLTAVIRRTEHGIPHIEATTWAGLGYGFGYAFAQDDICPMAADYATVDAERSRFFGPSGSYEQYGNGVTVNNLDSDFFWQQIIDSHVIEHLLSLPPPLGLETEAKQTIA